MLLLVYVSLTCIQRRAFVNCVPANLIAWVNYWEIIYVPELCGGKILSNSSFTNANSDNDREGIVNKFNRKKSSVVFCEIFLSEIQNYYKLWHFYWVSKRRRVAEEISFWLLFHIVRLKEIKLSRWKTSLRDKASRLFQFWLFAMVRFRRRWWRT